MRRIRAVALTLAAVTALATGPSAAAAPTPSSVPVHLSTRGKIVDGGNTARVRVGVSCPTGWQALEAFVYLVQDGNQSQYGSIPPGCDGIPHVYTVSVPALDVPFHEGDATGTAYVLLMGPNGQTRSGEDTETVTLSA